ncbi:MAG: hypothetical protein PHW04_04030 [Candidatus Wallbacteria bacterium]|nr:hypothetical protein [Candidatus Wallbacteria bacterium]
MKRIKEINHRLGKKVEVRPEDIGDVLRTNFFESSKFSVGYRF